MGLQAVKEREQPIWQTFPITETVTGFEGARLVTTLTGSLGQIVEGSGWYPNTMVGLSLGAVYYASASAGDYDADLVASILQADAAAPEASFSNVVDMLDWLNRG
jgi:hypothetical protein